MPEDGATDRVRYWPALDGLRGLAVIAVILLHAGVSRARGGFIGIHVFFVLSGFLITVLLLAERTLTGRIAPGRFYQRRALRLLPALVVLCAFLTLRSVTLANPRPDRATLGGVVATLLYAANWMRAYHVSRLGFLGLAWSLSVEEQFYILWPFTLIALLRVFRGRARLLYATLSVGIVASLVDQMLLWHGPLSLLRVFDGLDTNVGFLLMGCLLGVAVSRGLRPNGLWARRTVTVVAWIGLAYLSVATLTLREDSTFLYRGGLAWRGSPRWPSC